MALAALTKQEIVYFVDEDEGSEIVVIEIYDDYRE
jgi:hypothetical protein